MEAGLGGLDFGFEYSELQPVISASGVNESTDLTWDYEAPKGVTIQGSRFMHMLIKAPKGMAPGRAELHLVADILVRDLTLPAIFPPIKETSGTEHPLTVTLWE